MRNPPLTQLLLLRVSLLSSPHCFSLFQQILPLFHWFQMSSSWLDSLTTWLSSRTDNQPQPLPPFFVCLVQRENTSLHRLFLLPTACKVPLLDEDVPKTHPSLCRIVASCSPWPAYLCTVTNIAFWQLATMLYYIIFCSPVLCNPPDAEIQIWFSKVLQEMTVISVNMLSLLT